MRHLPSEQETNRKVDVMQNNQKTGYFDMNGTEYEMGDLVVNTLFGDIWLVNKYTEEERAADPDLECEYCLRLWADPDYMAIDLDEPEGFEVIANKGDEKYDELMAACKTAMNEISEQGE